MRTIRIADENDIATLDALDALCFPPGDVDREPASGDELRDGVSGRRVFVAEDDIGIIGFIHFERPSPSHIYISSLAVHPDRRHRGIGALLLDHLMQRLRGSENGRLPSISTVTSPRNYPMLRLLFSRKFVARTMMRGYFGPGRDRVYCQYKLRIDYVDPDERYLVPIEAEGHVDRLLSDENYVITAIVELPSGSAFEFCRFDRDDLAGLESDETSTSVTFAGTILAAITFVLGFSLSSNNFPNLAKALLLGSTLATTMALVVYTNAAGEIARLRSHMFELHMRTGNVLSEYGGVYPFLISLPIAFEHATDSLPAGLAASAFFVVSLALYERSRFSISSRFQQSITTRLLLLITVTGPVTGVLAIRSEIGSWVWTVGTFLVLALLSLIFLTRRTGEQRRVNPNDHWDVRD
ncbi:GNAT family N-acetyltransferase [Nocardia sp. bgisy134]|uniref:GNAT family N-acetyltransferase n=1 Tax=unclassified Nocardia TaxID=2637762 RepID=UPI003D746EE7